MFLFQKVTPQAGMDPAQQKIMQVMMPVMLGVISWNLASGLNLYWAAGNIIMILIQMGFNQTAFAREIRAHINKRAPKR
jgi:YidC/Oxa1 family membrane protein insertase